MTRKMTPLARHVMFLFNCCVHIAVSGEKYVIPLFSLRSRDINTTCHLVITSNVDTYVNVTGTVGSILANPIINSQIDRHDVNLFNVSLPEFPGGSTVREASVIVESDDAISLRVSPGVNEHHEGFLAIPVDRLGKEYYVGAFCALGGYCQITMATALPGETKVFVQLPSITDREIVYCYHNDTFWKSGRDPIITLTFPEGMQITTRRDLSGSYIYSDKPISVVTGTHTYHDGNMQWHYMEQLTPLNEWGKTFIFKALGNGPMNDTVNIIASTDNTSIEMTGFPTVRLPRGLPITRRVLTDEICQIRASGPIQVILFTGLKDSRDTEQTEFNQTSPGMTLVPSLEHVKESNIAGCKNSNAKPTQRVQVVSIYNLSVPKSATLSEERTTQVPYGFHKVVDFLATSGNRERYEVTSSVTGILICEESSIMPLSLPLLNTANDSVADSCTVTPNTMVPGDRVDNDCDGIVDEDYCFEDLKINASFVPLIPEVNVIDVTGFRVIKLRLASLCTSISMIQLWDADNQATLFQLDRYSIRAYGDTLGEECYVYDIENYHQICDSIQPFWLLWDGSSLCFDFGPVPKQNCETTDLRLWLDSEITSLRVGGLFSYEIYWLDIYRLDCGNLYSVWRCNDIYNNCTLYPKDVCSEYSVWATMYCRQYCEICIPDSFGRLFVVAFPRWHDSHNASVSDTPSHKFYIETRDSQRFNFARGLSLTDKSEQEVLTGNLSTHWAVCSQEPSEFMNVSWNTGPGSNLFLYFDTDVTVYVRHSHSDPLPRQHVYFIIQPVDVAGHEYMTSFFDSRIQCRIIAHTGVTRIWVKTLSSTSFLGSFDANEVISRTLNDAECSGTVFSASSPITVFCGGHTSHNNWQQLRPTETWGTYYIVHPVLHHGNFIKAIVRIITNSDTTNVTLSRDGNLTASYLLKARGSYVDVVYNNGTYIVKSNRPVSVGILYRSFIDSYANSSWTILPPVTDYMDTPVILINSRFSLTNISVVVADATPFTDDTLILSECYGFTTSNRNQSFMMVRGAHGDAFEPYISSTTNFKRHLMTNDAICHVTQGGVGDNIDNDCDGLTDEEVTCYSGYGVLPDDTDMDGGYGEDCLNETIGSLVKSLPKAPFCSVDADYGHWQVCDCNCSWVADLNVYKNLSEDSKLLWNQLEAKRIIKTLTLNTSKSSTHSLKLSGADDDRPSSTIIGLAAITVTMFAVLCFVFLDIFRLLSFIRNRLGSRRQVYTT